MPAPTWISHRGHCQHATENTAEAFRAAQSLGFNHLETDLRVTADGHLLLLHDPDLGRLSGANLRVEHCGRAELEQIELKGGEKLLFFDRFISEFSELHWILDIKPETALRAVDALQQWWQQPAYREFFERRVRFLFWQQHHEHYLQQYQPQAMCMARLNQCRRAGLACASGLPAFAKINPGQTYSLPPKFTGLPVMRRTVVQRYQAYGARVLAYLPETERDAERAVRAGADEILTNGLPL